MTSTHARSTVIRPTIGRSQRRSGLLGLGSVMVGVTAVGAAVAIFLIPAEVPTPAVPASGPAVTLPVVDESRGYIGSEDTHRAVPAPEASRSFTLPGLELADTVPFDEQRPTAAPADALLADLEPFDELR